MKKKFLIVSSLVVILSGCSNPISEQINTDSETSTNNKEVVNTDYSDNKLLDIEACSLSGDRETNVKVDIGYGDREYYAYTNDSGQLVQVTAEDITLQDDEKEDVTSSDRYCSDEAKVPGVEAEDLDEGHAIADSLGGVSNAYNITPQESTLNRHGAQSEMEEYIRNAESEGRDITDFLYIISYDNNENQIPSQYDVSFKDNGKEVTYSFTNEYEGEVNTNQSNAAEDTDSNSSGETTYENCTEAKAAGVTPLYEGDDGYSSSLDRDGDGVACSS